ncbi:MAG: lysophospholipid acyltransferase family protein [Clostridia bacterium]|nr:lysophospholipid acyltransferase family protein [Clostridia bacterium]
MLFPTKIVNKENFDKIEGGVIICNHYSVPDTLIPSIKLFKRELHVMAKAEAFASPIGNKFLRSIGAIPVHRGEPDLAAVREVMAVLRANKKFMIFPEGTRNRQGTEEMAKFKQGAARFAIKSKKPILPMMYYRNHKLFRRNYLYIGEPIYLDEFYNAKVPDDYKKATELIQSKMNEVRVLLDAHVDSLTIKK